MGTRQETMDVDGMEKTNPVISKDNFPQENEKVASSRLSSTGTLHEESPTCTETGKQKAKKPLGQRLISILTYTPPYLRHDPGKPLKYSLSMNLLFGLAGMSTVANLYYSHPILNILAQDFGVSNERASNIPTLAQAGYATGLLLINPLGDMLPRRPFVLTLMTATTLMWIGLCVTGKFEVFGALTYLTSVTTVTPQIMLPLVADLAPPERRATALSIVTSGLLLGLLFARIMSGVVTNFVSWRIVYWIALGLQGFFVTVLFLAMPDYPRTNKGLGYLRSLWSILTILFSSPLLIQASIVGFFTGACFTSFWTTLTFLLAGAPYHFSPLVIGLFALIGVVTMGVGPVFSRYVIDKCVPLATAMMGQALGLATIIVGTYTGTTTIAGPVLMAIGIDLGFQISQISNRSSIYSIDPRARNRVNTAYMVFIFCGQLTGTAVGNSLYARAGWERAGEVSIAFMAAALLVSAARGPRETRWVGWRGGWALRLRAGEETRTTTRTNVKKKEEDRAEASNDKGQEQEQKEKEVSAATVRAEEEEGDEEKAIEAATADAAAGLAGAPVAPAEDLLADPGGGEELRRGRTAWESEDRSLAMRKRRDAGEASDGRDRGPLLRE